MDSIKDYLQQIFFFVVLVLCIFVFFGILTAKSSYYTIILLFIIGFIIICIVDRIMGMFATWDFGDIHNSTPFKKLQPGTYREIAQILRTYPERKVSIAGGKFSQGGQTMSDSNSI